MELGKSRSHDIHCFCGGQARMNCRCVTEDFISMNDLFFIPERAAICMKGQHTQSAMFPADNHSVCSIANRREDGSWFQVYLQWSWIEAQFWERLGSAGNSISLNYWFTAGKASRASSWVLRYQKKKTHTAASEIFQSFRKSKLMVSKDNQLLSVCVCKAKRQNIKWLLCCC